MNHLHSHSHAGAQAGGAPVTSGLTIHWADRYDLTVSLLTLGGDRHMRRQTVELAGLKAGERVLDVGCGTGDLTLAASRAVAPGGQAIGIDAAVEMIGVARQKAARAGLDVRFLAEAIEALPFPDGSFDAVLSSLMMHHLPGDLKQRGLAEVRRVLKPGGRVLIVDAAEAAPHAPWLMRLVVGHMVHNSGFDRLPALVAAAGFSQVRSGYLPSGLMGFVSGSKPAAGS